jgi:hypothetical protein
MRGERLSNVLWIFSRGPAEDEALQARPIVARPARAWIINPLRLQGPEAGFMGVGGSWKLGITEAFAPQIWQGPRVDSRIRSNVSPFRGI